MRVTLRFAPGTHQGILLVRLSNPSHRHGAAAGERGVRGIALVNADEIVMQIVARLPWVSAQCTARQVLSSFEDH